MCTATVLPNNVGYVGMFYVKEAYRGIGAGKTVFDAAMARLTDTENNCLAGGFFLL